jgi:hypothetical protein
MNNENNHMENQIDAEELARLEAMIKDKGTLIEDRSAIDARGIWRGDQIYQTGPDEYWRRIEAWDGEYTVTICEFAPDFGDRE